MRTKVTDPAPELPMARLSAAQDYKEAKLAQSSVLS